MSIYYTILLHPSRGRAPNYSGLFLFPKLIRTKNESKQPRILLLGPSVHYVALVPGKSAFTIGEAGGRMGQVQVDQAKKSAVVYFRF